MCIWRCLCAGHTYVIQRVHTWMPVRVLAHPHPAFINGEGPQVRVEQERPRVQVDGALSPTFAAQVPVRVQQTPEVGT